MQCVVLEATVESITDPVCAGDSTGSLLLSAQGGSGSGYVFSVWILFIIIHLYYHFIYFYGRSMAQPTPQGLSHHY